jgi:cell division protein FtsN
MPTHPNTAWTTALWTLSGVGVIFGAFLAGIMWNLEDAQQAVQPRLAALPAPTLPVLAQVPRQSASVPVLVSAPTRQDLRPNKAVALAQPKPAAEKPTVFSLQLSSHPTKRAAEAYAAQLATQGFEPFVVSYQIPNKGTWYRVRLGHFAGLESARQAKRLLARAAIPAWLTPAN